MQMKKAIHIGSTPQRSPGYCPVQSKRFIAVTHKGGMVLIDARSTRKSISLNLLGETIWRFCNGVLFDFEIPSKCRIQMREPDMPDSRVISMMETMQQQGLLMFGDQNDKH